MAYREQTAGARGREHDEASSRVEIQKRPDRANRSLFRRAWWCVPVILVLKDHGKSIMGSRPTRTEQLNTVSTTQSHKTKVQNEVSDSQPGVGYTP